jgi:hypothetical protein
MVLPKEKKTNNDNKENNKMAYFSYLPSIASIMKIKGIVNKIKQTVSGTYLL